MIHFWHTEAPQEIAVRLKSDFSYGLIDIEDKHQLKECGLNELTKQKQISPFKIFLQQFYSLAIWATGIGADVMKRLVASMVGCVISAVLLTIIVIPALHVIWRHNTEIKNQSH
tara:strand:+ start:1245 stop:1586 length:342 start_codon:yes stop_codon:yes gene_type:complete